MENMQAVFEFLGAKTTQDWAAQAVTQLPVLLIDHAHCEKKAAGTALNLMFRYVDRPELLTKMSQLAREELLHFEQVLALMKARNIEYKHLSAAPYASSLHAHIRKVEPDRLIDTLIIGAFIEARSCERFYCLAQAIEKSPERDSLQRELATYYRFLLKSESRHFMDYLALAQDYSEVDIEERIVFFREVEAQLILEPHEGALRFHSGPLIEQVNLSSDAASHACAEPSG